MDDMLFVNAQARFVIMDMPMLKAMHECECFKGNHAAYHVAMSICMFVHRKTGVARVALCKLAQITGIRSDNLRRHFKTLSESGIMSIMMEGKILVATIPKKLRVTKTTVNTLECEFEA